MVEVSLVRISITFINCKRRLGVRWQFRNSQTKILCRGRCLFIQEEKLGGIDHRALFIDEAEGKAKFSTQVANLSAKIKSNKIKHVGTIEK
ncbi:hypothetical protein PCANC_19484 [Puccinia coronata f. sp. avenae]|uniref:Uncharacterized protein n=1 Tax=Puccinia coronata f. sp. avenae TaxID=200324 RepID=A0A2N5U928_9BASI|nr:hypothetical protein PCANC_19484 [Puccinia coronata f. sp. avenae]